jgi:hypothetical protein
MLFVMAKFSHDQIPVGRLGEAHQCLEGISRQWGNA